MALPAPEIAKVISTYQRAKNDTGSSEVQIALLTTRIEKLTDHLKINVHDVHTRYGLTKMVSQRRKLMRYFKRTNPQQYQELISKLNLRG